MERAQKRDLEPLFCFFHREALEAKGMEPVIHERCCQSGELVSGSCDLFSEHARVGIMQTGSREGKYLSRVYSFPFTIQIAT